VPVDESADMEGLHTERYISHMRASPHVNSVKHGTTSAKSGGDKLFLTPTFLLSTFTATSTANTYTMHL
jgi:hypothetical protein